jgi:hypothetical protein
VVLIGLVVTSFLTLLYILFSDRGSGRSAASAHAQSDLTNMMILFQTMRDILTQQKDLAREFNISIDRKVNEVRRLIQSTGDVRSELERTKRELAALATRTRRDVSALERRLQGVDSEADLAEPQADQDESDDDSEVHELEPLDDVEPPLEILPEPEPARERDMIDNWRMPDLKTVEDDEADGIEIEDDYDDGEYANGHDEPLSEEDVADTRAAYRDLLSLQPASPRMRGPSSSDVLENGRDGNGGQYLTPIQKRVYEYSDAGMRVPEIARELGVGKGEVRLILSLRHDRER